MNSWRKYALNLIFISLIIFLFISVSYAAKRQKVFTSKMANDSILIDHEKRWKIGEVDTNEEAGIFAYDFDGKKLPYYYVMVKKDYKNVEEAYSGAIEFMEKMIEKQEGMGMDQNYIPAGEFYKFQKNGCDFMTGMYQATQNFSGFTFEWYFYIGGVSYGDGGCTFMAMIDKDDYEKFAEIVKDSLLSIRKNGSELTEITMKTEFEPPE